MLCSVLQTMNTSPFRLLIHATTLITSHAQTIKDNLSVCNTFLKFIRQSSDGVDFRLWG